jgi:hypothetical protein
MPSKIKKNNEHEMKGKEIEALQNDLRHLGYLLPTNEEELEEFEKIFGSTQVMLPEHLKQPDFLFSKNASPAPLKPVAATLPTHDNRKKSVAPVQKRKTTLTPVKKISASAYFQKLVLAAEVVSQLYNSKSFGHIKFVKVMYLCEHVCDMQLGSAYVKHAAGPLDGKSLRMIDAEFLKRQWFKIEKTDFGYKYRPDVKSDEYKKYYPRYFGNVAAKIDFIVDLLKNKDAFFCEKVATLFAVWKEHLDTNRPIDNPSLIASFYDWSKQKKKFTPDELTLAIKWMKQYSFTPLCK